MRMYFPVGALIALGFCRLASPLSPTEPEKQQEERAATLSNCLLARTNFVLTERHKNTGQYRRIECFGSLKKLLTACSRTPSWRRNLIDLTFRNECLGSDGPYRCSIAKWNPHDLFQKGVCPASCFHVQAFSGRVTDLLWPCYSGSVGRTRP